jgi:hypothetical protein
VPDGDDQEGHQPLVGVGHLGGGDHPAG